METNSSLMTMETLQPVPAAVEELLAALHDPNLNLDHIVELIADESALSTEILRCGNSIRFGGREPATDLFAAITRIGMNEAYSALTALSV